MLHGGPLFPADKDSPVTHIGGLMGHNRTYILVWVMYYAWCMAFITWWAASPSVEGPFEGEIRSIVQISDMFFSALAICLTKKEWFLRIAKMGILLALGFGVAVVLSPSGALQAICAVGLGAGLGCVNIGVLIPFVFVLNNTEKFYAVLAGQALVSVLLLLLSIFKLNSPAVLLLAGLLLMAALGGVLLFRKARLPQVGREDRLLHLGRVRAKVIIIVAAYGLVGLGCLGVGASLLRLAEASYALPVTAVFHIGGLVGCAGFFLIFARYRRSVYLAWCIPVACLALALLCYFFSPQFPPLVLAFALILGAGSMIGMADVYYIMGVIGNKYNSMLCLRLNIIVIGMVAGVGGVLLGRYVNAATAPGVSMIVSALSLVGVVVLMLMYPAFAGIFYDEEWVVDSERQDVRREVADTLQTYKLSKREIETCMLLLDGLTMRQIAPEMGISFYTVNTYTSSIYRKLGINSRTELLVMFSGAAKAKVRANPEGGHRPVKNK